MNKKQLLKFLKRAIKSDLFAHVRVTYYIRGGREAMPEAITQAQEALVIFHECYGYSPAAMGVDWGNMAITIELGQPL